MKVFSAKNVSFKQSYRRNPTRGKARDRKDFGYLLKSLRKDDKR